MKNTLALVAIAGFAAAATAGGETFTLSLAYNGVSPVNTTDGSVTITVDVIGDSSFGTHMLGGEFGLSSGSNGMVTDIRWAARDWSTVNDNDGYDGAGNNLPVIYGQFVVFTDLFDFPPAPGSELGQAIGSFEIDIAADSAGMLDLALLLTDRDALQAVDVDFDARTTEILGNTEGSTTANGVSIEVVPAPSALALLGLGGIAAGRRRR